MSGCHSGSPGPRYALPTLTGYEGHDYSKNRAPAYSLGLKTYSKGPKGYPGPYYVGQVDKYGKPPYKGWTIESKAGLTRKITGPSPLSYAPEKMKIYTPAYSLGLKLKTRGPGFGPSPADYFPQYTNQGGITIGTPFPHLKRFVLPGPNAETPTDLFKPKAPAYSLGLKGRPLFGTPVGPGPKYHPGNAGFPQPHAYSFGMKHSKCSPPLITYEDNE